MRYRFEVEKIHTVKLEPGEVLLVKAVDKSGYGVDMATINRIRDNLVNLLETKKIMVYTNLDLEFLKLGLEEHLVDEFLEKELSKK